VNAQEVAIATSDGRCRFIIDDDFCASSGVSAANRETVKVFICAWLTLLSDSPLDSQCGPKPKRLFLSLLKEIRISGFKATVLRYSDLAHRLASQAYLYGTSSFNDEFIDDFKETPVFKEYHRYFKSEIHLFSNIFIRFLLLVRSYRMRTLNLRRPPFAVGWISRMS
jgi:hypothetical protein